MGKSHTSIRERLLEKGDEQREREIVERAEYLVDGFRAAEPPD